MAGRLYHEVDNGLLRTQDQPTWKGKRTRMLIEGGAKNGTLKGLLDESEVKFERRRMHGFIRMPGRKSGRERMTSRH